MGGNVSRVCMPPPSAVVSVQVGTCRLWIMFGRADCARTHAGDAKHNTKQTNSASTGSRWQAAMQPTHDPAGDAGQGDAIHTYGANRGYDSAVQVIAMNHHDTLKQPAWRQAAKDLHHNVINSIPSLF
jgi:hypothetical protein